MNNPRDEHAPNDGTVAPPDNASESLNEALDDLEDMLDLHGGDDADAQESGADVQAGVAEDGQYSIPLLSDIVTPPPTRKPVGKTPVSTDSDYADSVQRMAERLSSEIDVIVQSAVDEAIELLRRDIGERLREHLDITLPEVLEELVDLRRRP